jgi:hypothetical protein
MSILNFHHNTIQLLPFRSGDGDLRETFGEEAIKEFVTSERDSEHLLATAEKRLGYYNESA